VILLDTCALVFDTISPAKLGSKAAAVLDSGRLTGGLAISDISLWEISQLVSRGRISPVRDVQGMLDDMMLANRLTVIPISPPIALAAADDRIFCHKDPADRIIAATALHHNIPLVTCDGNLTGITGLITIW
jgi:PIN domain nuclease of toxin-antitoxin system